MNPPRSSDRVILPGLLLTGVFAIVWADRYAATPGSTTAASATWPTARIEHTADGPTLVLFVHPRCPCSGATLRELERAYAEADRVIETHFVIAGPVGIRSDLVEEIERLTRSLGDRGALAITFDPDDRIAHAFGAAISGEAFVYDARGDLSFHGGLTGARAHEGPNRGRDALVAIARGASGPEASTPVYGCALRGTP